MYMYIYIYIYDVCYVYVSCNAVKAITPTMLRVVFVGGGRLLRPPTACARLPDDRDDLAA